MNELRNFSLVVVLYLFSILTSNNLYGQIDIKFDSRTDK